MTGAQYSVVRVITAVLLGALFAAANLSLPLLAAASVLTVLFAVGQFHREAAAALGVLLMLTASSAAVLDNLLLALLAMAIHASLPAAPYASLAMRGATDPGSAWRFPKGALVPLWAAVGVAGFRWHPPLAALPLPALIARIRPFAWLALLGAGLARIVMNDGPVSGWFMVVLLMLERDFVKPAAKRGELDELIFYDGGCGLCHGFIRFVLSEDHDAAFKFAPLQSDTFLARVPEDVRKSLPDSVVVATADGRILSRAAAVAYVMKRLGGAWSASARIALLVPEGALNGVYDGIARIRYRLFAKPKDACPLMPKALRGRFLY